MMDHRSTPGKMLPALAATAGLLRAQSAITDVRGLITRRKNLSFRKIEPPPGEDTWEENVILRFYPNWQHLRKRNTIVEHPYGTVKRWHGAGYLLTKGKVKAAAEIGLSFLAYNFRRVINLLGTDGLIEIIRAW